MKQRQEVRSRGAHNKPMNPAPLRSLPRPQRFLRESQSPLFGPVHQIMHVSNGIHLLENMKLDEPAANQHLRLL